MKIKDNLAVDGSVSADEFIGDGAQLTSVFKVDSDSGVSPIFWQGTSEEYAIRFPSGADPEFFTVVTNASPPAITASDIVNVPSGNLVATNVQGALDELQTELDANISFDSTSSTRLADTSGTNTGDQDLDFVSGLTNGMVIDSPDITVSSDGATITLSVEKSGGGDITAIFSTGKYLWDTSPIATIALTEGSDISPQINYVYLLESNKTLTVNTNGFPATEHVPLATVLCQSSASAQTDGVYKVHAWTDHLSGTDNMGHISHLNKWIRKQPATWETGVSLTPTVGAATFDIATASGTILQLHDHSFPVFNTATGSEIYVVNDPTTAYAKLGNLIAANQDINGNDLTSANFDNYNLVIWGVVNESDSDCKLMVNVPDGGYNSNTADKAVNDDDNTAIYNIPEDFKGVGFLIARLTVQYSGGTYTILQNEDLRGQFPSTSAGGGATGGNEFVDNVFRVQDDLDITKQIAFQASGITTGTTRTLTAPDADGIIALEGGLGDSSEWATYTGTRAGGDLEVFLGDYNEDGKNTLISISDLGENITIGDALTGYGYEYNAVSGNLIYSPNANSILSSTNTATDFMFGGLPNSRAYLDFSNINTSNKTFTFPNASGTLALVGDSETIAQSTAVTSINLTLDWSISTHYYALTGTSGIQFETNLPSAGQSKTITIYVEPDVNSFAFHPDWTLYGDISGALVPSVLNTIVIEYVAITSQPFYRILISQGA